MKLGREVAGEWSSTRENNSDQGSLGCPRGLSEQRRWMGEGKLTCMLQDLQV